MVCLVFWLTTTGYGQTYKWIFLPAVNELLIGIEITKFMSMVFVIDME